MVNSPDGSKALAAYMSGFPDARPPWDSFHKVSSEPDVTKSSRSGDGTVTAVKGVTLTVADGEFVANVGRSGSGKATLMSWAP